MEEAGQKVASITRQATPQVANRRKNRIHQATAKLVGKQRLIVTEDLSIVNDRLRPGDSREARQERQAKGRAELNVLCIKAGEARCLVMLLDPRPHRSSQTCPCCASVRKKPLAERRHDCECGFAATRGQAAALSMLADGLNPWAGDRPGVQGRKLSPEPLSGLEGSSS